MSLSLAKTHFLSATELRRIHRNEQSLDTPFSGMPDDFLCTLTIGVDVAKISIFMLFLLKGEETYSCKN